MHTPHRLNAEIAFGSAPGPKGLAQLLEALWRAARDAARRGYASWVRDRHARATAIALSELDDRTLRDLGLHRSEIGSIAAEVAGDAHATRVRGLQAGIGLPF